MAYSAEVRQKAVELFKEKRNYKLVGELVGVNGGSVRNWCEEKGEAVSNCGKYSPRSTPDRINKAIRLREKGCTYRKIAWCLGVAPSTAISWCKIGDKRNHDSQH